ncbi:helix-turn-helix domain-containing protein [Desulfovibrio sp. OttesenSCG-928-C14]|nr:helix-turn-helix domain-containing protein [Desulfovibrio sp. OttesenSCG-928-C14]
MEKNLLVQWAVAKVIREVRSAIGITQVQLADFSKLSYPYISDVERGNVGVSVAALMQMAEVLKVESWELMRRIDEEMKRGPQEPEKIQGRPRKNTTDK